MASALRSCMHAGTSCPKNELGIGGTQGILGGYAIETDEIDGCEQQVAGFFELAAGIGLGEFAHFLMNLFSCAAGIGPVETDARSALLQFFRAHQCG